jgi:hypothetical protein
VEPEVAGQPLQMARDCWSGSGFQTIAPTAVSGCCCHGLQLLAHHYTKAAPYSQVSNGGGVGGVAK